MSPIFANVSAISLLFPPIGTRRLRCCGARADGRWAGGPPYCDGARVRSTRLPDGGGGHPTHADSVAQSQRRGDMRVPLVLPEEVIVFSADADARERQPQCRPKVWENSPAGVEAVAVLTRRALDRRRAASDRSCRRRRPMIECATPRSAANDVRPRDSSPLRRCSPHRAAIRRSDAPLR